MDYWLNKEHKTFNDWGARGDNWGEYRTEVDKSQELGSEKIKKGINLKVIK
jgi:hypothetical protein